MKGHINKCFSWCKQVFWSNTKVKWMWHFGVGVPLMGMGMATLRRYQEVLASPRSKKPLAGIASGGGATGESITSPVRFTSQRNRLNIGTAGFGGSYSPSSDIEWEIDLFLCLSVSVSSISSTPSQDCRNWCQHSMVREPEASYKHYGQNFALWSILLCINKFYFKYWY